MCIRKSSVAVVSFAAVLAAGCCSQVGTPGARPLKVVMLGNSFGECIMHYTPEFAAACGAPLGPADRPRHFRRDQALTAEQGKTRCLKG